MSKGGAGKVYFVLYLAVILELLIIIVERDEAEEHLIQKQKESMKIVESILSQLQSGSGSEGINTRPQDEITLQDQSLVAANGGTKIKQDRTYEVLVGVTDVSASDKVEGLEPKEAAEKVKKLIELANVQDLEYQIFYHNNANAPQSPAFMTDDSIRKAKIDFTKLGTEQEVGESSEGARWRMLALKRIELDMEQTQQYKEPLYKYTAKVGDVDGFAPATARGKDSSFMYSQLRTDDEAKKVGNKYKKRVFLVRFQPPSRAGWYKLRFASRTNRILGIRGDINSKDISDDEKVNIGTVQLKVKDLRKVKKTLTEQLEGLDIPSADDLASMKVTVDEFQSKAEAAIQKVKNESQADDPKAMERIRRIELYTYIAKLLAPGASSEFLQNRASIEFDIHVVEPPKRPDIDPVVLVDNPATYTFDKLPKTILTFQAGPFQAGKLPTVTCDPPLSIQVEDKGISATASNTEGGGQVRNYQAVINQVVPAGEYKITFRHTNQSNKPEQKEATLKVFESKLENLEDIKGTIENAYFGQEIELLPVPSDQKKIPAGQYYINAQISNQEQAQRGLQYKKYIPASAKSISADILWEDPVTKERVSLLNAPITGTPKQRPPKWVTNDVKQTSISDPRDPTITVSNIKLNLPVVDADANGNVTKASSTDLADVKAFVQKSDVPGYKVIVSNPRPAGGGYEVDVRIEGPPLRKKGQLEGTAQILISAKCKNKSNGEISNDGKATFNVSISY
ncbi:MAG: hypothetical protein JNL32_05080 [Candidatus Kapabacteria bacterium]|nr:hypothetical protein [Candidatus Kapabacteria bacterium]